MSQHLQEIYEKFGSDDEYWRGYGNIKENGKDVEKDLFPDSTRLTGQVTQTTNWLMRDSGVFVSVESQFSIEQQKREYRRCYLIKDIHIQEAIGILQQGGYPNRSSEQIERLSDVNQTVSDWDIQKDIQPWLDDTCRLFHQQDQPSSRISANDRVILDLVIFVPSQQVMMMGQVSNSQVGLINREVGSNGAQLLVQEEIVPNLQQQSKRQKSLSSQDTHHVLKNFINAFNGFIHHKASFQIVKRVFQKIKTSVLQHEPNAPQQYIDSLRDLMHNLIYPEGKGESYKFEIFKQLTVKNNEVQSQLVSGNLRIQTIKYRDKNRNERKIQRWAYKKEDYYEVTRRLMLWYLRRQYPLHIIRSGDMKDKSKASINQKSKARNLKYVRRWIQELMHPGVWTKIYMKDNVIQGPKLNQLQFVQQDQNNSDYKEPNKLRKGRKRKV